MEQNVLELLFTSNEGENKFKSKSYECVCALLNSNGGTLVLNTQKKADEVIRPIEQRFQNFIATSGVNKKLRISSETAENQITLKVKGHDTLCTMNYNLYLPTDTQVLLVSPVEVGTVKEKLDTNRIVDVTETSKNIPTKFVLNCPIGIQESKTAQFKNLKSGKSGKADLASRLQNNKFTHYVSAFANGCGGRLYCGVRDDGTVEGQKVTDKEKEDLTKKLSKYIKEMIWPEHCGEPQRGRHGQWDISFEPVIDKEGNPIPSNFVIVIFVAACQGGVFCGEPESYHIVNGKVKKMTFAEWKRKLLYPGERETKMVSKVSWCDWSSQGLRLTCDSLDGDLLRKINNGKRKRFTGHATKSQNDTTDVGVHLIVLLKRSMFHYRKSQFKEAEDRLAEFDKRLSNAQDLLIFHVRGRLTRSTMERSRGNHKESYEIVRDCLSDVERIAPSILTVEFYVHFGTMLTIIESNKDLYDLLKKDLNTGSFKDEAISFYNKTLEHLQEADYVPQSKVDMEQKTLINMAFLHLGCSLSGDIVDDLVSEEDIKRAESCITRAYDSAVASTPMTTFRSCHLTFAQSCCFYRKSQVEPMTERRIDLLEGAIRDVEDAEASAKRHHFDELSRYARTHAQVFKEELEKVEQI